MVFRAPEPLLFGKPDGIVRVLIRARFTQALRDHDPARFIGFNNFYHYAIIIFYGKMVYIFYGARI